MKDDTCLRLFLWGKPSGSPEASGWMHMTEPAFLNHPEISYKRMTLLTMRAFDISWTGVLFEVESAAWCWVLSLEKVVDVRRQAGRTSLPVPTQAQLDQALATNPGGETP